MDDILKPIPRPYEGQPFLFSLSIVIAICSLVSSEIIMFKSNSKSNSTRVIS